MPANGRSSDRRPDYRLACCLCRRPIPRASEVYALDQEWRRRFPDMSGVLACGRCAVEENHWSCQTAGGEYVPGHVRAADCSEDQDYDSWCHIERHGTHVGMVRTYPWSALEQGAGDYLRWLARQPTNSKVHRETLKQLQDMIDQWDRTAEGRDRSPDPQLRGANVPVAESGRVAGMMAAQVATTTGSQAPHEPVVPGSGNSGLSG
jgi:hypothetical protein